MPPTFEIRILCNTQTGEVQVAGPLDMKGPMINALSTAIQVVVNHVPAAVQLVHPGDHQVKSPNGKPN